MVIVMTEFVEKNHSMISKILPKTVEALIIEKQVV